MEFQNLTMLNGVRYGRHIHQWLTLLDSDPEVLNSLTTIMVFVIWD